MSHISIEGMDGVGKSTTCQLVAKKLGYQFVEKPLRFLTDEDGGFKEYLRIRDQVNENPDRIFTSWFYGLQNIYLNTRFGDQNIVTDRYIYSNYAWSGAPGNEMVYDLLAKILKKPDLTIILEAEAKTIKERLSKRDINDSDLARFDKAPHIYQRMKEFGTRYGWKTWIIHTDEAPAELVSGIIVDDYQDVIREMEEGNKICKESWIVSGQN